jgi:flagellum-specific peptidoglycan hydrolase FlgJ
MIEGTNSLFNFFSNFKVSLLRLSDNISQSIVNPFHTTTTISDLISPDVLFLDNHKSNQNNQNFSFLDNYKVPSLSINNNYQLPSLSLNKDMIGKNRYLATERLKQVSPQELKSLGANNKVEFFKTLLPAALEAENIYGVPASVTLAQAALESGWGAASIGGYNIFGIKGSGPAGTVNVKTKEWENGQYVSIRANFAKYNNFYEAVMKHGEVFHAGYKGYEKGLQDYAAKKDDFQFVDDVARTYATSPTYKSDIKGIMKDFDLVNMAKNYFV